MKCLKCGKIIEDNVKECPYCGNKIANEEFELPKLKNELSNDLEIKDLPLPKDEKENKVVIDVGSDFTFEHELPKVEENNELNLNLQTEIDLPSEKENEEDKDENVAEDKIITIETTESVKKRKKILVITSLIFLLLVVIGSTFAFILSKNEEAVEAKDYETRLKDALQSYYDNEDIDSLVYLLEEYKNDNDAVEKMQLQTKTACDSWIISYTNAEPNNFDEFDEITDKYRNLIINLNEYAKVTKDNQPLKYLKDSDREELIKKIEDIYNDGEDYVKGIALYNEKDYNRAYNSLKNVESDNAFYSKSTEYLDKIYNNVLELLENDIKKLENSIDSLNDRAKEIRYRQIVYIINEYNNVYSTLNLNSNEKYQNIIKEYNSKYSKYSGNNKLGDTDIDLDDMGKADLTN